MRIKNVFIGAYIQPELKDAIKERATAAHRTLSQEILHILTPYEDGRLQEHVEGTPTLLACLRCSHSWTPQPGRRNTLAKDRDDTSLPRRCPACKSPYWNRPRKKSAPFRS